MREPSERGHLDVSHSKWRTVPLQGPFFRRSRLDRGSVPVGWGRTEKAWNAVDEGEESATKDTHFQDVSF